MPAINTGVILAQSLAKLAGKKTGGFTDMGADEDEVVDVVHGKEWVASAPAVRNPDVRKFIDIFQLAQRNGTIRQLNMPAILGAVGVAGKKTGGYASQPSGSYSPPPGGVPVGGGGSDPELKQLIRENIASTKKMEKAANRLYLEGVNLPVLPLKRKIEDLEEQLSNIDMK